MAFQSELWLILQDDEYDRVWKRIYFDFEFNPQITKNGLPPFKFNVPVDCYDISNSPIYKDDETTNSIIKSAFIECMGEDDFIYALDWQHTCFRYNPKVSTIIRYPVFINDERYEHGGYYVDFPKFYPDGDYYFFIAKDFRWGYLSHPWLKKVWVYGNNLIALLRKNACELNFISCIKTG